MGTEWMGLPMWRGSPAGHCPARVVESEWIRIPFRLHHTVNSTAARARLMFVRVRVCVCAPRAFSQYTAAQHTQCCVSDVWRKGNRQGDRASLPRD